MCVQTTPTNILKQCETHLKHTPVFSVTFLLVKLTKNVAILIQIAADVCLQTSKHRCELIQFKILVCGGIIVTAFPDIQILNNTSLCFAMLEGAGPFTFSIMSKLHSLC